MEGLLWGQGCVLKFRGLQTEWVFPFPPTPPYRLSEFVDVLVLRFFSGEVSEDCAGQCMERVPGSRRAYVGSTTAPFCRVQLLSICKRE